MRKNVGYADRLVRLVIGLGLLGWYIIGPMADVTRAFLFLLPGAALLVSAFTRVCPAYQVLGISTCGNARSTQTESG